MSSGPSAGRTGAASTALALLVARAVRSRAHGDDGRRLAARRPGTGPGCARQRAERGAGAPRAVAALGPPEGMEGDRHAHSSAGSRVGERTAGDGVAAVAGRRVRGRLDGPDRQGPAERAGGLRQDLEVRARARDRGGLPGATRRPRVLRPVLEPEGDVVRRSDAGTHPRLGPVAGGRHNLEADDRPAPAPTGRGARERAPPRGPARVARSQGRDRRRRGRDPLGALRRRPAPARPLARTESRVRARDRDGGSEAVALTRETAVHAT